MDKLAGKRALITGGSSGIGLESARLFRAEGARLAITGRDREGLARALLALGEDTMALRSDAADLGAIDALYDAIRQRFGGLDVLMVNAGIARAAPFEQVTEAQFDEVLGTNLKGAFFTIQKALPLLSEGASVIVTTSIANRRGAPNYSVYAASKAALRSLVQSLSLVLVERGVRVNAISPGPVATPMFGRGGLSRERVQERMQELAQKSPLRRLALPAEIAKVALFLACDDSSYLVGEEIVVDGGVGNL